jgi:hypothetical protein
MSSKLKEIKKTKPVVNDPKVVAIVPVNSENSTIESTPLKTEIIHRDEKGRFLKGFSGNMHAWATRKMNTPLAFLCREKVEKWADVLNSLITGPTIDPMIKLGALKLGFEYGFGKPLQGSEARDFENKDYKKFVDSLKEKVEKQFGSLYSINSKDKEKIRNFIVNSIANTDDLEQLCSDVLKPKSMFDL